MAKILVTGGCGFIGSTLVDSLITLGHTVVVIDDLSAGKKSYLNPLAKFYQIDVCDQSITEVFALHQFDYVFHLAAQIDLRKSVVDPIADNRVNVLGGLNILQNCYKFGVKKIIFSSTGGAIYGEDVSLPTTESELAAPISPYGIHKFCFEKYLHYYFKVYDLPYIALRFANVYGPRQYKGGEAGVIAIFVEHGISNKMSVINGDGLQTRDYVYVDDVVLALIATLESDHVGVINIGTGKEQSVVDIVLAIERALGHKILQSYGPAKLGEQQRSCLSYSQAQMLLKWQPQINLNEGIARTVAWTKTIYENN